MVDRARALGAPFMAGSSLVSTAIIPSTAITPSTATTLSTAIQDLPPLILPLGSNCLIGAGPADRPPLLPKGELSPEPVRRTPARDPIGGGDCDRIQRARYIRCITPLAAALSLLFTALHCPCTRCLTLPAVCPSSPIHAPRMAPAVISLLPVRCTGSHTLEVLQCMVERRVGGETGVRAVTYMEGQAVWEVTSATRGGG